MASSVSTRSGDLDCLWDQSSLLLRALVAVGSLECWRGGFQESSGFLPCFWCCLLGLVAVWGLLRAVSVWRVLTVTSLFRQGWWGVGDLRGVLRVGEGRHCACCGHHVVPVWGYGGRVDLVGWLCRGAAAGAWSGDGGRGATWWDRVGCRRGGLRLEVAEWVSPSRWRWVLRGPGGEFLADHEVDLDAVGGRGTSEWEGFTDLEWFLRWRAAIDRRLDSEAELVAEVGDWITARALGPQVARVLATRGSRYSW